jgi:hypothetical protein
MMKKNVVVVSHERSGTHFLINTIIKNFGYSDGWVDFPRFNKMPNDKKWYDDYCGKVKVFCVGYRGQNKRVFKTHHQVGFFESYMDDFLKYFTVFYIVRDPRDVGVSCFYYFNKHNNDFPVTKSVGDLLLRVKPYKYAWDSGRSIVKSETLVDRWALHVSGWKKHNVHFIKFSDLKRNFSGVVHRIGKVLNKPVGSIIVPLLDHNVVESRGGREGDWRGHLSSVDNKRVVEIVNKHGLGEFLG